MKKIATVFALLFLSSCQDASVTGNDPSNTTTLSARVERAAGVSLSLYDSAITVKVSLVAGSYSQAQTHPFSNGGCDFTGVPIGVPYTLSFQGLDGSGTMIWSGTATGTTVGSMTSGGIGSTNVTVVAAPTPVASNEITVITPNGGETFHVGGAIPIQWSYTNPNFTSALIQVVCDGVGYGLTTTSVDPSVKDTSLVIPDSVYSAVTRSTIAFPASSDCKVKISDYVIGSLYDTSDASFTILEK